MPDDTPGPRDGHPWTADDQRRVDTFSDNLVTPLIAAKDPHLLFVSIHGLIQAAGAAMVHDLAQRPELLHYYLEMADRLRAHLTRAVPSGVTH